MSNRVEEFIDRIGEEVTVDFGDNEYEGVITDAYLADRNDRVLTRIEVVRPGGARLVVTPEDIE